MGSLSPYAETLKQFQAINAKLDRYLIELSQIEFNLDPGELQTFRLELEACNDELQRTVMLKQEVEVRGIVLPFEMDNVASTRNWLTSLL